MVSRKMPNKKSEKCKLRCFTTALLIGAIVVLSIRITSLETTLKDLEREIYDNDFRVNHRMQEYESYIEFLEREYEPYIQELKEKQLREML